jgi:transcription factor S
MIFFCPLCSNSLLAERGEGFRLKCRTCSYFYPLARRVEVTHRVLARTALEIVEQGAEMKSLPIGEAFCPRCASKHAYYEQRQTRSADEAATIFYTCANEMCGHKWKED